MPIHMPTEAPLVGLWCSRLYNMANTIPCRAVVLEQALHCCLRKRVWTHTAETHSASPTEMIADCC